MTCTYLYDFSSIDNLYISYLMNALCEMRYDDSIQNILTSE
jgi:hypothetical protein